MPLAPADTAASELSIAVSLLTAAGLLLGIIPRQAASTIERLIRSFSSRRLLILLLIPALSFTLNAAIAKKNGLPRARVQDEFSYLLAADTFAHGRMTNPTPAFWEHFESPHELMHPTYMSKYPPGQGLALALGQVLCDVPIAGIWLTTAAACAVIYWMLLGFVPPVWAMLGGFVAILHPQLIQWSQNYWGGSVAVLGGAMVLGSWVRLTARNSPRYKWILILSLGLALGILANSRPYEGLVLAIAFAFSFLWIARKNASRIAIPLLILLLPIGAVMGWYNFRVTGHLLRMPFEEYARQYDIYPKFWFLPKRPAPIYRSDSMAEIHTVFERGDFYGFRTPGGFFRICRQRIETLILMHAQPWILLLPLLMAVPRQASSQLVWVWFSVVVFALGLLAENFFLQHYAAPVTAALLLLIIVGWRRLAGWHRRGKPLGRLLAAAVGGGFIAGAVYRIAVPVDFDSQRVGQQALIDQAADLQIGRHLIFVRYGPGHLIHDEWVYNQADLDHTRILWARYMSPVSDAPVALHYSHRQTWILTVGKDDLDLHAYPLSAR